MIESLQHAVHQFGAIPERRDNSMPSVLILVLNWNNGKDTLNCLDSLRGLEYGNRQCVVLDNGSTDDSVIRIRAAYPGIEMVELGENTGFARANNAGIRLALDRNVDYVWLLNNDTRVAPEALDALVQAAEADATIGAVGSALYHMHRSNVLQAWGGGCVNFWSGRAIHFRSQAPEARIEYLTAASMLVRRAAIESVGLFDEAFFLYWEDVDYCFRLRKAGWRLAVAGGSVVLHKESSTAGKNRPVQDMNFSRSSERFFTAHSPVPFVSIGVNVALRVAKRAFRRDWAGVRAVWSGTTSWRKWSLDK